MVSKLIRMLFNNLGLKILAVIFSVILWIVVVNIDDPKITRQFTTKATIENDTYLSGIGKYYKIKDNSNTITFKVTGKRSYIEKMSNSDFKAVADLEAIEDNSRIPVEITAQRYSGSVAVSNKSYYVEVSVEDLLSEPYVISVATSGELAEGRALGDITARPNILRVSGPKSVMDKIAKATATVDVSNMSSDVSDSVIPILVDSNGKKIDTSELTLNVQSVIVSAQILDTKDVGLTFQTTGTLPEGYHYVKTTYTPETVKIKGESSVLNTINTITVPSEVLDLTDATEDIEKTVDISTYLPPNVSLVDPTASKVEVLAKIEKEETRSFDIPTANITAKNLLSRYSLTYSSGTVSVSITGLTSDLDALDPQKITGTIDASGMRVGEHSVKLSLNLDDQYKLAKSASVTVDITLAPTSSTN